MATTAQPAPGAAHPEHQPTRPADRISTSVVDAAFGSVWPDLGTPARRGLLLACVAIGAVAGLSIPYESVGLATALVLLASGLLVLGVSRFRRSPFTWACAVLCIGFTVAGRRTRRGVDRGARSADQRSADHRRPDERAFGARAGAGSDRLAGRGAARPAVAGPHVQGSGRRHPECGRAAHGDRLRARAARLRAAVRHRRRDRGSLGEPGAARGRGRPGAPDRSWLSR